MTLREIAMYCKIKQSEREADKYKQQSDLYESVLTGKVTEFVIPDSWTVIRRGAFNDCVGLKSIYIPDSIKTIGVMAFYNCTSLKNLNIPNSVTSIGGEAFRFCRSLTDVTISNSVTTINYSAFNGCASLTDIIIPSSVILLYERAFASCSKLTNVTLGNNFNCNNLDLSASTMYSVDTLVAMLTALADRTGQTAYTLTLGATNLAKLSDAQKAIATDKNWTLA